MCSLCQVPSLTKLQASPLRRPFSSPLPSLPSLHLLCLPNKRSTNWIQTFLLSAPLHPHLLGSLSTLKILSSLGRSPPGLLQYSHVPQSLRDRSHLSSKMNLSLLKLLIRLPILPSLPSKPSFSNHLSPRCFFPVHILKLHHDPQ